MEDSILAQIDHNIQVTLNITWKCNPDLHSNTSISVSLKVERSQLRMLKTRLVETCAAVLATVQFWMPSSPWVSIPLQTFWKKFRTLRLENNSVRSKCSLICCLELKLRKSYQTFPCTVVTRQMSCHSSHILWANNTRRCLLQYVVSPNTLIFSKL
jgi:hypothetical protein